MAKAPPGSSAGDLLAEAQELHRAGKLKRAEKGYRACLALRPADADALLGLGVAAAQQGNFAEAARHLARAVEASPSSPAAHYNLGRAYLELGRPVDAAAELERSLALAPGRAETHNNLASALRDLGRREEAIGHYRAALAAEPRLAEAAFNLGATLRDQYRLDEAVEALAAAARLRPDDSEIHYALAEVLYLSSRPEIAAKAYREVIRLAPRHAGALSRLALTQRQSADWQGVAEVEARAIAAVAAGPGPDGSIASPFALAAITDDPAVLLASARASARRIADRVSANRLPPVRPGEGKIRLAYVAGDFREHATSYLIADLIESHERADFEVVGYSFGPAEASPMRRRMERAFDRFVEVRDLSSIEIARRMRADRTDIAVDLVGYNQFQRMEVFACRPAPVQVNYLGWPGTTGARFMDYILADPVVAPEALAAGFSEAVVELPRCYQANDRKRKASPEPASREASGLPRDGIVFCCFNNIYKISPQIFDVWCRILEAVPGSVLWLLDDNPAASANLRTETERRGIARDRLVLAPRRDLADHLARHRHADVFLDTLPYNAHTTASDALFMGVPVVTCPGRAFQSRVAASLLANVGVRETVAGNLEDYREIAIRLARDADARGDLRRRIGASLTSQPLFDTDGLRRSIETAYRTMVERARKGLAPAGFKVT